MKEFSGGFGGGCYDDVDQDEEEIERTHLSILPAEACKQDNTIGFHLLGHRTHPSAGRDK